MEQGKLDFLDDGDVEGTNSLKEQHEASFAAACTACRALRDLSALSKDFAAVVTDDILRINTLWSTCVVGDDGYDCSSGGLIADLLILLKHANEAEAFYKAPRRGGRGSRRASFSLSSRRRRRGMLIIIYEFSTLDVTNHYLIPSHLLLVDARRRCGLYVVQLLLAMVVASDEAVTCLRSTSGLVEEVIECTLIMHFLYRTFITPIYSKPSIYFHRFVICAWRKIQTEVGPQTISLCKEDIAWSEEESIKSRFLGRARFNRPSAAECK